MVDTPDLGSGAARRVGSNPILGIIFFICFFSLFSDEYSLNQLKQFADGLNIEGGTIQKEHLHQGQLWANLCVILDRPFEDGLEWQELTRSNPFPLKEASLLDYNEPQVNFTYVTILHYYLTHAHQILGRSTQDPVKILVQVHRNTSGPRQVELLKQLMAQCYPNLSHPHVEINYCSGVSPQSENYCAVDIVLSFSLVAGFHPDWKSGSLLIPRSHIPFSLKTSLLSLKDEYTTENHLFLILPDLLETQDDSILEIINHQFCSLNSKKLHQAQKLMKEDFKEARLLQVENLFNPSQLAPTFKY